MYPGTSSAEEKGILCSATIVTSSSCSQSAPVKLAGSLSSESMSPVPPGCSPIKALRRGNPEHVAPGVMGLDQAIAIEEETSSWRQDCFILVIARAGHHARRHAGCPEFGDATIIAPIGRFVSCISIVQLSALAAARPTAPFLLTPGIQAYHSSYSKTPQGAACV